MKGLRFTIKLQMCMATLSKTDRKLLFWFIVLLALAIVPWFV